MTMTHASRLLAWYDRHRRTLPWRARAGRRTEPYRVWLSEIMLQQTTVATVGDYFRRFLERWPTVEALAARRSTTCSRPGPASATTPAPAISMPAPQAVAARHGGRFPEAKRACWPCPASAPTRRRRSRAIAFDQPASAVDGNVERVIARLFAIETPLPDAKPEIRARAGRLVPQQRAGDYAQAMMDLGATVCTPRRPRCVICPLMTGCRARKLGIAEDLPRRLPKATKPGRRGLAFVLARKDGAILLRKRPAKGLLGGMDEVPSSPWREGKFVADQALGDAPVPARWTDPRRAGAPHIYAFPSRAHRRARHGDDRRPGQAGARHELVHGRPHDRARLADGDAQGDRARREGPVKGVERGGSRTPDYCVPRRQHLLELMRPIHASRHLRRRHRWQRLLELMRRIYASEPSGEFGRLRCFRYRTSVSRRRKCRQCLRNFFAPCRPRCRGQHC